VANKIWYIENRQIKEYPGTYQEYEDWQAKRTTDDTVKKAAPKPKPAKTETKQSTAKKTPPTKEREVKKLHKELEVIEERISQLEEKKTATEAMMADETTYANQAKLEDATQRYDMLKHELSELQQQWEKLAEEIMEIDS